MALLLEIGRKWTVVVLAAIVGTFYEYLWTNQTSCKLSYDFEGKMLNVTRRWQISRVFATEER